MIWSAVYQMGWNVAVTRACNPTVEALEPSNYP